MHTPVARRPFPHGALSLAAVERAYLHFWRHVLGNLVQDPLPASDKGVPCPGALWRPWHPQLRVSIWGSQDSKIVSRNHPIVKAIAGIAGNCQAVPVVAGSLSRIVATICHCIRKPKPVVPARHIRRIRHVAYPTAFQPAGEKTFEGPSRRPALAGPVAGFKVPTLKGTAAKIPRGVFQQAAGSTNPF